MIVFLVYFCMLFFGLQAQDKISLYNNANVLHGAGKFVEAEQVFNQVLNSDLSEEEKEQAYFNLGCSQAEQKKYQEAIKSFEEVAKVNEENLRAKKNIEILKQLEQKQEQKQKQDKKQKQEESNKSNQEKNIITNLLKKYNLKEVYAFGSRTTGKHNKYSDLDLVIKDKASDALLYQLEDDFKESNLAFKIDIVTWDRCDDDFRKRIESQLTLL